VKPIAFQSLSSTASRFRSRLLPMLLAPLLLAGCDREVEVPPAPPPEVTVIRVEPKDTPVTFQWVAKTASSRRVEIRSRVEGFLEKRAYTEGGMVKEGDVMFVMDTRPFEAQLNAARAELAQQEARMKTAKANLDRVEPLARQNAVAKKELDDAMGSYNAAAAAVEAARAKVVQAELNLGYCTIKSPVTGLASYAIKREGAFIGIVDGLLTYVAQTQPMWVEFSVSENEILKQMHQVKQGRLKIPADHNYTVEIVLADGTIYPHTGRLTFADASLSERTGTFLIRAEIDNPDDLLRPGQFVRANLKGAMRPNAILVPQRAVQQGAQGSFVWLIDAEGKAQFQPVTVGPWHGDDWFIDEGLEGGETVVVDGAQKLRSGIEVKVVEPTTPGSE